MHVKILKGFTLIELMVVVVVIGLLAAIGIPSYTAYVTKSYRTEAMTTLLKAQAIVEEYRAQNNNVYPNTANLPASVSTALQATAHYTYAYSSAANSSYQITATAKGSQANDQENNVPCNVLTVDNVGTKSPQACWGQ